MKKFAILFLAVVLSLTALTQANSQTAVSQERAIEIALAFKAAAGFASGELSHAVTTTRNNRLVWDIEFWHGNTEYEFYIDAATGQIVVFEMENHPSPPAVARHRSPQHPLDISAARANEIAIAMVGGGEVIESNLGFYQGDSVYQLAIEFGARRFQVFVTTDTGEVVRLRSR